MQVDSYKIDGVIDPVCYYCGSLEIVMDNQAKGHRRAREVCRVEKELIKVSSKRADQKRALVNSMNKNEKNLKAHAMHPIKI